MEEKYLRRFTDIETKELLPGFFSKMIHTSNNTINFLEAKEGSVFPLHQHIHEQIAFVLEGEFELEVDGINHLLKPGLFVIVPPNIPHGGRAITNCRLLDIFSPAREDYQ